MVQENAQAEQMLMAEFVKYKNKGGDLSFEQFVQAVMQQQEQSQGMEQPTMMAANGGAGIQVYQDTEHLQELINLVILVVAQELMLLKVESWILKKHQK